MTDDVHDVYHDASNPIRQINAIVAPYAYPLSVSCPITGMILTWSPGLNSVHIPLPSDGPVNPAHRSARRIVSTLSPNRF